MDPKTSTPVQDFTPQTASDPAKVNVVNAEKKGTNGFAIVEKIKEHWKDHIEANKKTAEERQKAIENIDEFIINFDPKRDKKNLTPEIRKRIVEIEKLYQEGTVSIKDLIAPASMEIGSRHVRVNDQYARSFFVFSYPRYLEANWLSQVVNFDASMDISIFVYPTESVDILKILRKKVAEMRSTKHINEKKGVVESVSLETALEDAQSLRVDLQRGNERFFQVGIYFTLYADTEEKLNHSANRLETLLGGQLLISHPADFRTERAFESCLPQGTDELEVLRNMNTSPLSTIFPFVSSTLSSDQGILYGVNRHNNSLVIFDRFELENANSVIFAKSGAGKSYAVKLEVLRSLMLGTDAIIIDPENEYETLCQAVGGTYTRISLSSSHRINPFDLPFPIEGSGQTTASLLKENIINLTGLMALMLGKLTPDEEGIMDKALRKTYEIKSITVDTENPRDFEMPIMRDLQKVLESMEGGHSLATRLERYTEGTFSGIFSEQSNVNLSSGLVCFCIRDLEEQLRPIAMYIILNYLWNRIRSKMKKRLMIIDEAWNIVQHEDSGRFLHNLVKRARKYYLGITTITQDVEDFLQSPWGKPIITNSSLQILLKQAPSAIEILKQTFNLTDGEKYLLLNSNVGQGVFFAGGQHVAIQIIASNSEHQIITTDPEELMAQREKAEGKVGEDWQSS